ncbi:MAG: NAD(P)/FAD-dependent oxidoreductase [Solirubrobacterales bacterium]
MSIRVNNLVLSLEEDTSKLLDKAAEKLKISKEHISKINILKQSIDARKKDNIRFNYSVEVFSENEKKITSKLKDKDILLYSSDIEEDIVFGSKKLNSRPVVVGMGPAGMFCALELSKRGYRPIVIERGEAVEDRTETVENFWETGVLNPESNVQFGEGGAGTFSDGKLTTRIKDKRCDYVLKEFVRCGAPENIIYSGKPHIGTDILKIVVKNIREEIKKFGGEILFSHKLEDILINNNSIKSIIVNNTEMPCEVLVLAIGHSSRDTYEMLYKRNIFMEPKPFAIGLRIEHSQKLININQFGKYADHPRLGAADYRLAHTCKSTGRGVYSFCMCPGGTVVSASSEENRLVTNGMSDYSRDKDNSNSAIVVTVNKEDFLNDSPLSGVEYQRHFESLAFKTGGGGYIAPIQLAGDFINDKVSKKLGNIEPTYKPGYAFADLKKCLPEYVSTSLKEGLVEFDKKIKNFSDNNSILTGIETRTSAPVKLTRNEKLQSISLGGLYPTGEGAGFAGGIISAAVDGIKCAESIMTDFSA